MMKKLQLVGVALVAVMFFFSFEADANISDGVRVVKNISIDGSVDITKDVVAEIISTSFDTDCDDWLKNYEAYVNKYIIIIKKMKANPSDASILADYTDLAGQAAKWAAMPSDCMGDSDFIADFMKIQTKLTKAMI